jgi:hypothetical protein
MDANREVACVVLHTRCGDTEYVCACVWEWIQIILTAVCKQEATTLSHFQPVGSTEVWNVKSDATSASFCAYKVMYANLRFAQRSRVKYCLFLLSTSTRRHIFVCICYQLRVSLDFCHHSDTESNSVVKYCKGRFLRWNCFHWILPLLQITLTRFTINFKSAQTPYL